MEARNDRGSGAGLGAEAPGSQRSGAFEHRRERRTHRERSAETQQRLRDAALECLAELGYSGSSIVEIARRAGLTASSIQHHFGGKAELMVASLQQIDDDVRELLERMPAEGTFAERFRRVMNEAERFVKPTRAHVELRLAARSDSDLAACLSAYSAEYQHWTEAFNDRMFGDVGGTLDYRTLVVAAFTGLVIQVGDSEALRAELVRLERMLSDYLDPDSERASDRRARGE